MTILPKISIIIPAYNVAGYLPETLKSIFQQGFFDFEIIIVNDGSSDNTASVVEKITDPRIKLFNFDKNQGKSAAVNFGLGKAKGECVVIFDADDIMAANRLQKQWGFLQKNPDVDLVYGDMIIMEDHKRKKILRAIDWRGKNPSAILKKISQRKDLDEIKPYKLLDYQNENKIIPSSSTMIRKSVFQTIKLDEKLRNSEDYDLWLQIIGHNHKIARLPIITYFYRRHAHQKSRDSKKMLLAARHINQKLKSGGYFK